MITKDREYRSFEFDSGEEMKVEGIPVVFESPTVILEIDGIKYYEVIDRNAFANCDMSNVVLNIDHCGKPAAKTKNKTLDITIRDSDVFISADLNKNATGRELHEDIRNGFYDKMSFAFTVSKESYDKETRTRRILEIDRLYDVSAVTVPAYDQTSIMARSFFDVEAEKERLEKQQLEDCEQAKRLRQKEALKLRLRLGGTYGN